MLLRLCFFLILCNFLICCHTSRCEYSDGITLYFKDNFNFDLTSLKGAKHYYFVPLESCEICIYENLKFLSEIGSKRITVVFIGQNPNESWKEMISQIRANLATLDDPEKKVYRYETGINKPLLVSIEDGTCVISRTVNESEIVNVFHSLHLDD